MNKQSEKRREQADKDFSQTFALAARFGLLLKKHSDTHYSIAHPDGWLLNVYPGNQRLYYDRNKTIKPPFLNIRRTPWRIYDVVVAITQQTPVKSKPLVSNEQLANTLFQEAAAEDQIYE